jgi:hypothetical protein
MRHLSRSRLELHLKRDINRPKGFFRPTKGAFTLDVKLVLNKNLGGILGGI